MIRWGRVRGHPSSGLIAGLDSKISGSIRWFNQHRGESRTVINHYIYLMADRTRIVEACFGGVRESTLESYDVPGVWGVLVEHVGFTETQYRRADAIALEMVDLPYNYPMLLKQGVDGFLSRLFRSDVYLVRRFRIPWIKATVCSGLGVRIHNGAGWRFYGIQAVNELIKWGSQMRVKRVWELAPLPAKRAAPDCIWDDVFQHRPDLYIVRGEINPDLRPKLLEAHALKIDADLVRRR